MTRFDPDMAVFGTLAARLSDPLEETVFSYANPAALGLFGGRLVGRRILDVLTDILGSAEAAREAFERLRSQEPIIIEGKLADRHVQFHSIVEPKRGHLQAAIMDTTESRRAQEGFEYTAGALSRAAEARDEITGQHIVRVNHYSGTLARLLGQNEQFVADISLLAQLHDVGKIHIDPHLLRKPESLSSREFEEMKQHTIYGARIIGDHVRLSMAREIALGHHEKWDGTGYPDGLSAEMIPLSARIVTIVDVFDALVSERPHKPALNHEETYRLMTEGDDRIDPGTHFDPHALQAFLDNYHLFTQIHNDLAG